MNVTNLAPLAEWVHISLTPPSSGDNVADVERIKRKLQDKFSPLEIPLDIIKKIPSLLRRNNWQFYLLIADMGTHFKVRDVSPVKRTNFGLAIDLGSTTIAVYIMNLETGQEVARTSCLNEQIQFGTDILDRLHYARYKKGLQKLQESVITSIKKAVSKLSLENGVSGENITALTIAGNTSMTHLFLGLETSNIYREPYTPTVNSPGIISASEFDLPVHPEAVIYFFPNVGSYLGGDIISGVIATEIHLTDGMNVLVDIGTNGEIVVGNKEWMVGCAGAAGPALEGGVVKCGMRAAPGAIEQFHITPEGKIKYKTIGDKPPIGLCGSGLISCIAQLFLRNILDHSGTFANNKDYFVLVPASETGHGQDIVITSDDIANFLRTKSAVNAAFSVLLENLGLSFEDVSRFYAAGAFGNYLDIEDAITIGLFPDISRDKFKIAGNTSVAGAKKTLLNRENIKLAEEITKKIAYLELNADAKFMNYFTSGLFIPHTNLDLFPSVKQKVKSFST
jgi:uncharacterized 2Fe-2S/4Fe-4S cluster protein (DUF4445 family)